MSAKDVIFDADAREKMLRGVDVVTTEAMVADKPREGDGSSA